MNQSDFDKGWAIILSQPWAKVYRMDEHAEATQRAFVKQQVDRFNPEAWAQACWFIASQWDKMPTTHDFIEQSDRIHRTMHADAEQRLKPKLTDQRDEFPGMPDAIRAALERSQKTGSFAQAMREILPTVAEDDPLAREVLERWDFDPRTKQGTLPGWSKPTPEVLGESDGRR